MEERGGVKYETVIQSMRKKLKEWEKERCENGKMKKD